MDKNLKARKRKKVCPFCADKVNYIEYKDAGRLRRFTFVSLQKLSSVLVTSRFFPM